MSNIPNEIIEYIGRKVDEGDAFFRARNIADETGLKTKQVGYYLANELGEETEFNVSKWGRSRSITWHITRTS